MNYKIGDWVRVRQWDDLCQEYRKDDRAVLLVDGFYFNPKMQKFCGRWGKITDKWGDVYRISFKGVDNSWNWSDAMLESNEPYQVGDQVIVSSMDALDRDFDMNRDDQSINPTFFTKSEFEFLFQNPVLATIKDVSRKSTGVYHYYLKTCIYTGCTQKEFVDLIPEHNFSANMALFDYIKVGPYIKERGGLACKTTNQVFYKKVSASPHNTQYAPANYLFQKEYK